MPVESMRPTDDIRREEPAPDLPERPMLEAWLDYHRDTFQLKLVGADPVRLAEQTVPPSTLSLLGLLRHLTEVERSWFRMVLNAEDAQPLYYSDDNPDGDILDVAGAGPEDVDIALARWQQECAHSREIAASFASLDETARAAKPSGFRPSVRWVLCHMVEEYARHNGHADLLREALDGAVGE